MRWRLRLQRIRFCKTALTESPRVAVDPANRSPFAGHVVSGSGSPTQYLRTPFGRSSVALSVAAVLGPFWLTQFGPSKSLTVGTALIVTVGFLLSLDLMKYRPAVKSFATHAAFPISAVSGLVVWAFINASVWGCLCGGFHGLADLGGAFALALCIGSFGYRYNSLILFGAAGGVVLAGAMAIAGVKTLHSPLGNTAASTSTQLSGVYGNPNYLGYAVAFAIPIVLPWLVKAPWRARLVLFPFFVLAVAVVGLTFSRGALLAAGAGGLVALTMLAQTRRKRAAVLLGGIVVAAGVATLALPQYREYRKRAVFGAETVRALGARDASGWDGGPEGLISDCCASLSNLRGGAVLKVVPSRRNEGVSYGWGVGRASWSYLLTFQARSAGAKFPLSYGLEDNQQGNGAATSTGVTGTNWRRLRIRWAPTARSPAARLYMWEAQTRSPFFLTDVRLVSYPSGRRPRFSRVISTRLARFAGSNGPHELDKKLSSYIHERLAGIRLAADAFLARPVRGIGWESFPRYAATHGSGEIPTHNEYLRIASELGTPGILFLALVGLATLRGFSRHRQDEPRLHSAATGVIAAGCVGLLFVNGLTVSAASLPLALAVGLVCAPVLPRSPNGYQGA